ncbi:MAG: DUF2934 domain-containing protein [Limisphaerales bacterium]
MKTPTLKTKSTGQYASAKTIHTPQLPRYFERIRQRAREIYRARGGMMGMTLNDWLKAEQELKRDFGKQTNGTNNHERHYDNDQF